MAGCPWDMEHRPVDPCLSHWGVPGTPGRCPGDFSHVYVPFSFLRAAQIEGWLLIILSFRGGCRGISLWSFLALLGQVLAWKRSHYVMDAGEDLIHRFRTFSLKCWKQFWQPPPPILAKNMLIVWHTYWKKFMCLISWERTQKGTHLSGGFWGSKTGSQTGHFRPQKV